MVSLFRLSQYHKKRKAVELNAGAIDQPNESKAKSHKLEVMSVGLEVPERRPIAVTGHWLVSALLRNLVFDVAWTAKVLFIDAPPGTGEEIQVIARELPLSGAIFVTTPQDLAQMDAERTLGLLRECGVPVIGIVHNMASFSCPHCQQVIDLYQQSNRMREPDVHILGRIPFDTRLGVMADRGTPLVLADPQGAIAYEFAMIGGAVRAWLAERDRVEDDVLATVRPDCGES